MLWSIVAVFAGWLAWGAMCVPVNMSLMKIFPDQFREDGGTDSVTVIVIMLLASIVYSIVSGMVTAWLAGDQVMRHVIALALFNFCFGVFVQVSSWKLLPVWYHIPFLALIIPCILLGGKLWLMFFGGNIQH